MSDAAQRGGPYRNEILERAWRARLSLAELGRRAGGIPRPRVSQIANGWMLPTAEELDAIADALGVPAAAVYSTPLLAAIETTREPATEGTA